MFMLKKAHVKIEVMDRDGQAEVHSSQSWTDCDVFKHQSIPAQSDQSKHNNSA